MKFYFCEKCGKRITDKDLDQGLGKDKKLKGVYCQDCSIGVMTMETLPLTEERAHEILQEAQPKPTRKSGTQRVPTVKQRAVRASGRRSGRPATGRMPRGRTGRAAPVQAFPGREEEPPRRPRPVFPILLAAGGLLLVLVGGILLFSKGASRRAPKKSARTVPQKPTRAVATHPPPVRSSSAPRPPVRPPSRGQQASAPHPVGPSVKPTPKAAPTAPVRPKPKAPEDGAGEWRSLFNGKDLQGWTNEKHGKPAVKDGYIQRLPGRSIKLKHDLPGASVEISAQVFLSSHKANMDFKTACGTLVLWGGKDRMPASAWAKVRIVVREGKMSAWVDGKRAAVRGASSTPRKPAYLSCYFKGGKTQVRLRDVKIRALR